MWSLVRDDGTASLREMSLLPFEQPIACRAPQNAANSASSARTCVDPQDSGIGVAFAAAPSFVRPRRASIAASIEYWLY